VETNMTGDHAVAVTAQERSYPQVDCVGLYLWIWERLIQTEAGTHVEARQVRRDPSPR
jgi:hypothetical protein